MFISNTQTIVHSVHTFLHSEGVDQSRPTSIGPYDVYTYPLHLELQIHYDCNDLLIALLVDIYMEIELYVRYKE